MKNHISITHSRDILQQVRDASYRIEEFNDLSPLLADIGDARYVLLGEASHGTHEYYTWRAQLTKRLILEKGFNLIAVEGDWPDCYRINRYIKGYPESGNTAREVLQAFNRWPTWMWANWEMVALTEWLHNYNMDVSRKVGFYGLDVYSLWESMEAIAEYLKEKDPEALRAVQEAMNCFEPFNVREGFSYASREYGLSLSCKEELQYLLTTIRRNAPRYKGDPESAFAMEQNALVAAHAERYYNVMLNAGGATWNIRDLHMTETVNRLMDFHGEDARVIIWEHNTHIGDARATDMKRTGLINVGQLVKEQHEKEGVYRVGFGSYKGSVIASYRWGGPVTDMRVPEGREGSWENLLHEAGDHNKLLFSKDIQHFISPIGHRAIGVVYDPDYEYGNYVPSVIPTRYEAFIFINETKALHPLHVKAELSQMPETWPWGV
jgi:erythromycin esterase-like protein